MIEDKMVPVIDNLLSLRSQRQQLLAANIANLDTPGSRAVDVSFEQELGESMATNPKLVEVDTREKPDGNNVDLDRELTEITRNGIQYITLVQFVNHRLKTMRSSIVDGGRV
jgi:flagellar basal-body rod protein FlgB